jgi:ribosomal protein S18 acetylase RimI-like enzyme
MATDIRIAVVDDADAVAEVGAASFRAAYEGSCSADELEEHLAENFSASIVSEQLCNSGVTYLLATIQQVPAGIAKLRAGASPEAIPSRLSLEIQQFYVSPGHQRMGIGADLMRAAWDVAKSASVDGVWLSVWENANWAVGFYLSCGFTQVGTIDFSMSATVYNDFLMWRPVTENAGD